MNDKYFFFFMKSTRNNIGHLLRIYATTDGEENSDETFRKHEKKKPEYKSHIFEMNVQENETSLFFAFTIEKHERQHENKTWGEKLNA